jgi:hypothetical protein
LRPPPPAPCSECKAWATPWGWRDQPRMVRPDRAGRDAQKGARWVRHWARACVREHVPVRTRVVGHRHVLASGGCLDVRLSCQPPAIPPRASKQARDPSTSSHTQSRRRADAQTRRHPDTQSRRHADAQTRRRADAQTRRRADAQTRSRAGT